MEVEEVVSVKAIVLVDKTVKKIEEVVDFNAVVATADDAIMVTKEVVVATTNNIININMTIIITNINNNLMALLRTHIRIIRAIFLYIVTVQLVDYHLLLLRVIIEITKETIIKVAVSKTKVPMITKLAR